MRRSRRKRAEHEERIAEARRQRRIADEGLEDARALIAELRRLRERNHFAEGLRKIIMEGH